MACATISSQHVHILVPPSHDFVEVLHAIVADMQEPRNVDRARCVDGDLINLICCWWRRDRRCGKGSIGCGLMRRAFLLESKICFCSCAAFPFFHEFEAAIRIASAFDQIFVVSLMKV